MYELKPPVQLPGEVFHSRVMYELRNIHAPKLPKDVNVNVKVNLNLDVQGVRDGGGGGPILDEITEQTPLPAIVALEARQEKILAQLAELKDQVSTLYDILKHSKGKTPTTDSRAVGSTSVTSSLLRKESVDIDVVINVHPSKAPYSLLALINYWEGVNFDVKTYTHSSVKEPADFPVPISGSTSSQKVTVSLIWKEVSDLEVVVSGVKSYPLIGEMNFLRYLSRQVEGYNYEQLSLPEVSNVDLILDLSHSLTHKTVREGAVLSNIAKSLGNNVSVSGTDRFNIADIGLWSILKQNSVKNLPKNLNDWFLKCEKTFLRK